MVDEKSTAALLWDTPTPEKSSAAAERALERHIVSESRVLRFSGLIIGRHHANVMQAGAPGIQGFFVN